MNRRSLLIGAGVAGAALVSSATIWSLVRQGQRADISATQHALLDRVADITIPAGETLGALGVQAPAFVALAIAHGVNNLDASVLQKLESDLAADGRAFMALDAEAQVTALTRHDAAAFAQNATTGEAWRAVKTLIATAYYTSETGASKELQYELVPGRFDPDLPVSDHARAWSSDWTAWDFG